VKVGKKVKKVILPIVLMIVFALSAIASFTVAYLSDTHSSDVNIKLLEVTNSTSVSQTLSPADLVANNSFTKTVTSEIGTTGSIYLRTYAVVSMQTIEGNDVASRTDLVSLTNVTKSAIGEDNKYYYTSSNGSTTVTPIASTTTLTLDFTFQVSSLVNSDLFLNSDGTINTTLKTTITYYFEYCDAAGFSDWNESTLTTA